MQRWTAIWLVQQKNLIQFTQCDPHNLAGLYYFTNMNDKLHNHNMLLYHKKLYHVIT
jgi:hypothetical protein